jgi:hypothetical protein
VQSVVRKLGVEYIASDVSLNNCQIKHYERVPLIRKPHNALFIHYQDGIFNLQYQQEIL